ncbi:MAG: hypothetical protein N2690_01355 [Rhodocyclaceae bacterium]|nr:hypothetical protein [Rhodocyclaceae bacterium]
MIPQSLRWLVDLGLNPRAIVALMALAKRRGAQLQDVCAAACDGLRRARQPFAYLAKLLRLDRDWAWAAKHKEQQQRRHEDEQRQQSERCRLRQQLLDLQGKTLIDRARGIKLLIGGSAALVMSLSSSAVSGAVPLSDENLLRIVEQIRCGTLVAA